MKKGKTMAKKDIDLEMDDFDFDKELGGLSEGTSFSNKPRNAREAVTGSLKDGSAGFIDGLTGGSSAALAKKVLDHSVPGKLSVEYSKAQEAYTEITDAVKEGLDGVRKEGKKTVDTLKKLIPGDNAVTRLLGKISSKLGEDEQKIKEMSKEQQQQNEINSAILASLGEQKTLAQQQEAVRQQMEEQRHVSSLDVMRNMLAELKTMNQFSTEVANNYYRKSLEIQFKQLYTQQELLGVTKTGFETFKNQFESIVKNTGLPEVLKIKTSENLLKSLGDKYRQELANTFYDKLDPFKNMKDNIVKKITNFFGQIKSGLSGAQDMMGMGEGMMGDPEMGGPGLVYMLSSLVGDAAGKKIFGKMGEKLWGTEGGKKATFDIKRFFADPEGYVKTMKSGTMKTLLQNFIKSRPSVRESVTFSKDPNAPAFLDNRFKDSVIKVIPTLLTRIYGEIATLRMGTVGGESKSARQIQRAIRKGEFKAEDFHETFDFEQQTFQKDKNIEARLKTTAKLAMANGASAGRNLVSILTQHGGLPAPAGKIFIRALVNYLYSPVAITDIMFMARVNGPFISTYVPVQARKTIADAFKKLIKAMQKDNDAYIQTAWNASMEAARKSLPNLDKFAQNLVESGKASMAAKLNLVNIDKDTGAITSNREGQTKYLVDNAVDSFLSGQQHFDASTHDFSTIHQKAVKEGKKQWDAWKGTAANAADYIKNAATRNPVTGASKASNKSSDAEGKCAAAIMNALAASIKDPKAQGIIQRQLKSGSLPDAKDMFVFLQKIGYVEVPSHNVNLVKGDIIVITVGDKRNNTMLKQHVTMWTGSGFVSDRSGEGNSLDSLAKFMGFSNWKKIVEMKEGKDSKYYGKASIFRYYQGEIVIGGTGRGAGASAAIGGALGAAQAGGYGLTDWIFDGASAAKSKIKGLFSAGKQAASNIHADLKENNELYGDAVERVTSAKDAAMAELKEAIDKADKATAGLRKEFDEFMSGEKDFKETDVYAKAMDVEAKVKEQYQKTWESIKNSKVYKMADADMKRFMESQFAESTKRKIQSIRDGAKDTANKILQSINDNKYVKGAKGYLKQLSDKVGLTDLYNKGKSYVTNAVERTKQWGLDKAGQLRTKITDWYNNRGTGWNAIKDRTAKAKQFIEGLGTSAEERKAAWEKLKSQYFSSKERLEGKVKDFKEWLKESGYDIDEATYLEVSKAMLSDAYDYTKEGKLWNRVKAFFKEKKQQIMDNLEKWGSPIDPNAKEGQQGGEITEEQDKQLRAKFFESEEYKSGSVTDYNSWLEALGFRKKSFWEVGSIRKGWRMAKGFWNNPLFKKTRELDRKLVSLIPTVLGGIFRGIGGLFKGAAKGIGFITGGTIGLLTSAGASVVESTSILLTGKMAASLDKIASNTEKPKEERKNSWLQRMNIFKKIGDNKTVKKGAGGIANFIKEHPIMTAGMGLGLVAMLLGKMGITMDHVKSFMGGMWNSLKFVGKVVAGVFTTLFKFVHVLFNPIDSLKSAWGGVKRMLGFGDSGSTDEKKQAQEGKNIEKMKLAEVNTESPIASALGSTLGIALPAYIGWKMLKGGLNIFKKIKGGFGAAAGMLGLDAAGDMLDGPDGKKNPKDGKNPKAPKGKGGILNKLWGGVKTIGGGLLSGAGWLLKKAVLPATALYSAYDIYDAATDGGVDENGNPLPDRSVSDAAISAGTSIGTGMAASYAVNKGYQAYKNRKNPVTPDAPDAKGNPKVNPTKVNPADVSRAPAGASPQYAKPAGPEPKKLTFLEKLKSLGNYVIGKFKSILGWIIPDRWIDTAKKKLSSAIATLSKYIPTVSDLKKFFDRLKRKIIKKGGMSVALKAIGKVSTKLLLYLGAATTYVGIAVTIAGIIWELCWIIKYWLVDDMTFPNAVAYQLTGIEGLFSDDDITGEEEEKESEKDVKITKVTAGWYRTSDGRMINDKSAKEIFGEEEVSKADFKWEASNMTRTGLDKPTSPEQGADISKKMHATNVQYIKNTSSDGTVTRDIITRYQQANSSTNRDTGNPNTSKSRQGDIFNSSSSAGYSGSYSSAPGTPGGPAGGAPTIKYDPPANLKIPAGNKFYDALVAEMDKRGMSPIEKANILANCDNETGTFTKFSELLSYSDPKRVVSMFSKARLYVYGPKGKPNPPQVVNARLESLRKNPVLTASVIYGDRMGNGPIETGDGYKYRGRGLIQLTGLDQYRMVSKAIGVDLVNNPDLILTDPEVSAKSVLAWWDNAKRMSVFKQAAESTATDPSSLDKNITITRKVANAGTWDIADGKVHGLKNTKSLFFHKYWPIYKKEMDGSATKEQVNEALGAKPVEAASGAGEPSLWEKTKSAVGGAISDGWSTVKGWFGVKEVDPKAVRVADEALKIDKRDPSKAQKYWGGNQKAGQCASGVKKAMEMAGVSPYLYGVDAKEMGAPSVANPAFKYKDKRGPLLQAGYEKVASGDELDNYKPEKGDIVVLQPGNQNIAHPQYGHVAVWTDKGWASDVTQRDLGSPLASMTGRKPDKAGMTKAEIERETKKLATVYRKYKSDGGDNTDGKGDGGDNVSLGSTRTATPSINLAETNVILNKQLEVQIQMAQTLNAILSATGAAGGKQESAQITGELPQPTMSLARRSSF